MTVEERLSERASALTPSERRIGERILQRPELVAFGTVADVADAAEVGAATVVRFATKLGYDGYTELQASVQRQLSGRLRPAAERIRSGDDTDLDRHAAVEIANVRTTLAGIDAVALAAVVDRLADDRREVLVLSGVASRGVALQFTADLDHLRPGVRLLDGTQVDIARMVALAGDGPTLVVLDLRRYERWLLDAYDFARREGVFAVALTDSVLSPLAATADRSFVIEAASAGPFDSHVGTLALLDLLVARVAAARRRAATQRLDRLERAWRDADALTDD
jgi:DNA-binding MurR/RpiR family transcriptional regulator